MRNVDWRGVRGTLSCAVFLLALLVTPLAYGQGSPAAGQKTPPALGTIKSVDANLLMLSTDSGPEVRVQLPPDVKVFRIPPGSKDLKEATAISLSDLQPGDRVLVRMRPGEDASSLFATAIIAMKKADIAEKQAKEREEWQRHGVGGLVKSVDAASGAIVISTFGASGAKDVTLHTRKETVLRRYAAGSVKFDEAKAAPISEIQPGDQLRARGTRSADGAEFTADEIVSGSFRNIAGTVSALDAAAGTLTVADIATKKPVELKVAPDSQMRKVPVPVAQRIAARLKGDNGGGANGPAAGGAAARQGQPSASASGSAANASGAPGGPGRGAGGSGDMQQMLSRLPASPLGEFQKGDVVMIVATAGSGSGPATVITLLGGVEPILQATTQSQAASILSPWSLNQGGGGDAGTP